MAGFVDGVKKVWDFTIGGGYAEAFANSDIFPYRRFEELAAIPPAKMTDAERREYEKLQPQIERSAEGFGGTLGVVTQRGVEAGAGLANEVATGAGRGLDTVIKEQTTFGKILGWISENWQLVLAGVVGVVGMFSGGFMGTIATAGAALLAGNSIAEKLTGKSLLKMGSDVMGKFTHGKSEPQVSVVKEREMPTIAKSEVPSMEELAKASGINYTTNHAARETPKAKQGFVQGLVKGAQEMAGATERFA